MTCSKSGLIILRCLIAAYIIHALLVSVYMSFVFMLFMLELIHISVGLSCRIFVGSSVTVEVSYMGHRKLEQLMTLKIKVALMRV